MLNNDLIKQLKENTGFQEFLRYLSEAVEGLSTTYAGYDLKDKNDALGEKLRANIVARDKMLEILRPFIDYQEKQEASEEAKEKAKAKFGL